MTAQSIMKKIFVFLSFGLLLLQGCENDSIEPKIDKPATDNAAEARTAANTFYVSTTGSDAADGSSSSPWKTLKYAVTKTPANQDYAIQLSAGTFIESGLIEVPLGVSIYGAGIDKTILKATNTFYYYPSSPAYATDKFLLSLNASSQVNGNQTLSGFTIDGDSKKLHGGIYVHYRSNVIIDAVKVQYTNFTGIWLWDVKDSKLLNSHIINSAWGSSSYCVGALNIGNVERVEIANLNVNENTGYGIKAIGPGGNNNILSLKIRDSRISVHPYGLWNNGSAPNIAIELWSVNLVKSEIYNTYVDNTISLINSNATPSTGVQTIRVHHNTIDMETRAKGAGYGVELTIHDAEIDHNYFLKGTYGIANWDHAMKNWNIHHNTFYALQGTYPGEIVRSQSNGLHNVKLYNNTIEFAGTKTMNVIGVYGGASSNIDVKNNLFINNNTSYSYYPNEFIHRENGATISGLIVKNNSFNRLPVGTVAGTYASNLTTDPLVTKTGNRPNPYYLPKAGSPLVDAGLNVGYPFTGSAPEIGAFEYGGTSNAAPQVNITSPVNNASFALGTTVNLSASATDTDGTIAKVQFYNGATLLGQDITSPYSFSWTNVPAGNYSITAKATDNAGATTTSNSTTISIGTSTSSVNANVTLDSDAATLRGKMVKGYDALAAGGSYFYVPSGSGKNYIIPPPASAVFTPQLTKTGNYVIWARVKAPSSSNQTSYVYNGKGRWFTWSAGVRTSWTWVKIMDGGSAALFPFVQGSNQFHLAWLDDNVQVDQVIVTSDLAFTP